MVKKSHRGGKVKVTKGTWTAEEDKKLMNYVIAHGDKKWRTLPLKAGLNRCGKSCRLRWLNYLRPGIKRGNISEDEEDLIIRLHNLLGNRWSIIAARIPGRTDNEIKNHWNTHLRKRSLTIDDLNNKQNQSLDDICLLPPKEMDPNSSLQFPIMETPADNSPARHGNESNDMVVSSCMEQPNLEFDIEQFLSFVPMPYHHHGRSSDVGLEDYEISELDSNLQNPLMSDLSSNFNSQKCWDSLERSHTFEFDDLDQFSDRYYGLFSPLVGQ